MVEGFHLPECISAIPLRALGSSTRQLLAIYLDPPSCTTNNDGITNDASGLAELAGFDYPTIRYFESKTSKTIELLNMWRYRQNGTLGNLVGYLLQLERFDCLTDIWHKLLSDGNKWANRSRARDSSCSVESMTGSGTSTASSLDDVSASVDSDSSSNFLTVDDVNAGQVQKYSACVCCADGDIGLARDIVRELSKTTKLFVPQDHLVGGAYEFEATAEVIEDRCDGRLVVLLSNHYTNSPACYFATQFAKTLDPDARRRRIIPIVTQEGVTFPRILRGISTIKHYRCTSMTSFLAQIIVSLSYQSPTNNGSEISKTSAHQNRNNSIMSFRSSVECPGKSSDVTTSMVPSSDCNQTSCSAADISNVPLASMVSNESRITNDRSSLYSSLDPSLVSPGIHLERVSCHTKILNVNPLPLNINGQSEVCRENYSAYSMNSSNERILSRPGYNDLSPVRDDVTRQLQATPDGVRPQLDFNIGMSQMSDVNVEKIGMKAQNSGKNKSTIFATLKRVFTRSPSNKNMEKSDNSKTNAVNNYHVMNTCNVSQPLEYKLEEAGYKRSVFQHMTAPSPGDRSTESDVIFV
ncbi:uncharacterized protein LOC132548211 [Ylistrum balloti]|uniref:uncharacterized protein LOC132548211 n=1 Tax=Ylistrum balloti TaxID=509963 RepID=UPI002905C5F6|nr:uncharacterized protein LOC132548211 [Ylistrum balloti]